PRFLFRTFFGIGGFILSFLSGILFSGNRRFAAIDTCDVGQGDQGHTLDALGDYAAKPTARWGAETASSHNDDQLCLARAGREINQPWIPACDDLIKHPLHPPHRRLLAQSLIVCGKENTKWLVVAHV